MEVCPKLNILTVRDYEITRLRDYEITRLRDYEVLSRKIDHVRNALKYQINVNIINATQSVEGTVHARLHYATV